MGGVAILLSLSAGHAFADAQVRLLHAVPGAQAAQLRISGDRQVELVGVGFGEASQYAAAPAGRVRLELVSAGRRTAGRGSSFENGARYTVVAAARRGSRAPELRVYRDGRGAAGRARLRLVTAAPEVSRAEVRLDGRPLGSLRPDDVAGYVARDPGTYRLAALKPGGGGELAATPRLDLVAGTALSAYLIGSAGERTRFVVLEDGAVAPSVGPATGLGGLADGGGPDWLLALLAAGAAGLCGALIYSRAATRAGRARG